MKLRSFYLIIVLTLMLTACGGQVTPTSAPISTVTQLPPTTSSTIQAPSTDTIASPTLVLPTPPPVIVPTNPPDCTDDATFVTDVTVPDGTSFKPGTSYTKTWRISNSGTCTWNSDYSIVFASGEKAGAPDSMPLANTAPGGTLDISMDLTAPSQNGTATTNFQLRNPAGKLIAISGGIYIYVSIYVSPDADPVAATEPSGVSDIVPISDPGNTSGSTCPYTTDSSKVAEVISAINSYRAQNGAPALSVNSLLTQAAQSHAADMACNNLFGHKGSDGSSASIRVANTGYLASAITENVYGSYPPLSGQGVVAWWATDQIDPRHNQNLIDTKYTEFGVAYAFHNNFGYYVVDFADSKNKGR